MQHQTTGGVLRKQWQRPSADRKARKSAALNLAPWLLVSPSAPRQSLVFRMPLVVADSASSFYGTKINKKNFRICFCIIT